ncbi:hypothetical protein [Lacihabitans soyangensis]|uniref:Uncharacterized protein n=1 Tax=Lacihabitans soyangensis TaxID=869394 RepID=A0AAE3KST9_9BACT|nr:hypothetical protein [Lacihabitans soyangensis]MCP9762969.1 hypothetical protein [Lacihabitans soyangensis]
MKLKDLKDVWHVGSNYAILSLPFVSYSVQPHWMNRFETDPTRHRFMASFKSYIAVNQTFETEFATTELAIKGCEEHLQKLLAYVFIKLEDIVDFGVKEPLHTQNSPVLLLEVC